MRQSIAKSRQTIYALIVKSISADTYCLVDGDIYAENNTLTEVKEHKLGGHMNPIKKIRFIRTLTVVGFIIALFASTSIGMKSSLLGVIVFPFTCLSGIGAFLYYHLEQKDKAEVYTLSLLHLYTIAMHPYCLFGSMIFINILCVI